ncbi:hypothetical protein ACJIZ3_015483 [Penstemon smallii]|uniref:Uncharacterized protein n=1 Tax=Penstemon smallii TaxID=265156 RepID=A0ABD3RUP2_9LAMI
MSSGGRFYWVRNRGEEFKAKGIIVVFAWISIGDTQLKDLIGLYSSLGWDSLVSRSDYLNPYVLLARICRCFVHLMMIVVVLGAFRFIPERATSLAFSVLRELVKELRCGPCPVVFASFSGGSKSCMYKVFQIIEGCSEVELSQEDSRLVASCISGQIYDSDPIDFTSDLGARFALHRSILKIPGSSKLVSLFAKGVTSSMDALFLTSFGSQRVEFWQTLYSSVGFGGAFLILCSENEDTGPFSTLCIFAQHLQDVGGIVKVVNCSAPTLAGLGLDLCNCIHVIYLSRYIQFDNEINTLDRPWDNESSDFGYSCECSLGNHKHQSIQYTSAVTELLEEAVLIFSKKIQKLRRMDGMHDDEISDLICDLQNAAVDSCQSFKRIAAGPNDHFFLPSSSEYQNTKEFGSLQEERKEGSHHHRSTPCMNANSVLGQILFDVCVPKNVECWDIKFSGSLNREPFASVSKRSPFSGIKHRSKL